MNAWGHRCRTQCGGDSVPRRQRAHQTRSLSSVCPISAHSRHEREARTRSPFPTQRPSLVLEQQVRPPTRRPPGGGWPPQCPHGGQLHSPSPSILSPQLPAPDGPPTPQRRGRGGSGPAWSQMGSQVRCPVRSQGPKPVPVRINPEFPTQRASAEEGQVALAGRAAGNPTCTHTPPS